MGTGSDKKGQDKKQIRGRDYENCKAGRQISECKATLVWTRKKERRLCAEKDDGDGGARQKEKRKVLITVPLTILIQKRKLYI